MEVPTTAVWPLPTSGIEIELQRPDGTRLRIAAQEPQLPLLAVVRSFLETPFIACVDGLKGLPEAIEAVFPKTQVQLCIVHKVRNSLKYVPWKERRAVAADLRAIYGATTLADAEQALERFADRWDTKYPAISPSWLANWDRLTVFFDYPPAIRRAIYTTNAIESLNYSLRKVLKGRGAFPNDEAIVKLLYMGLQHVAKKWTQPIPEWKAALNQFVILFGERVQV